MNWEHANARAMFDKLAGWGYEVNFYGVLDLEGFLEAVVMLPTSVTSDFNFPRWNFYGRGSGQTWKEPDLSGPAEGGGRAPMIDG